MPELHHIGRIAYEAWRAAQIASYPNVTPPVEWPEVANKDWWQAAGTAASASAWAQSGNYTADTAESPHTITFANGRQVTIAADGSLVVGWAAVTE